MTQYIDMFEPSLIKLSEEGLINNIKNILKKYKNTYISGSREQYVLANQLFITCDKLDWKYSCFYSKNNTAITYSRYATAVLCKSINSFIELIIDESFLNDFYLGLCVSVKSYIWDEIKKKYNCDNQIQINGFGGGYGNNELEELLIEKLKDIIKK